MTNEITPTVGVASAAVCFLLGGWLLCWGARIFLRTRRAERAGVRVLGTVVAHTVTIDSEDAKIYHPVFEFTTTTGKIVRIESSSGTSDFLSTPVGIKVPVSYDPQRPEDGHIVGSNLLSVGILCFLGTGFCAMGVLALVAGFLLPH